MIAEALKKRFAQIQSPSSTDDESEESGTDKENQLLGPSKDSFNQSPSYFNPCLLKPVGARNIVNSPCTNGNEILFTSFGNTSLKSRKRKSLGPEALSESKSEASGSSPLPMVSKALKLIIITFGFGYLLSVTSRSTLCKCQCRPSVYLFSL